MRIQIRYVICTCVILLCYISTSAQGTSAASKILTWTSQTRQEPKKLRKPQLKLTLSDAIKKKDIQASKALFAESKRKGEDLTPHINAIYDAGEELYRQNRFKEALGWYTLAAEAGHGLAQSDIGYMYLNGKGVEQSDEKALEWFRRSAALNSPWGQANLGHMYEEGKGGVKQSVIEAVKLYKIASAAGNEFAKERLRRLGIGDEPPLLTAVKLGNLEETSQLLKSQGDVNMQDKDGASLLLLATLQGNLEMVRLLLVSGAKPDLQDKSGAFPLLAAIFTKRKDLAEEILKARPNVNLANASGDIPITSAFVKQQFEIVQPLIKAGADVNKPGRNQATALHWAVVASASPGGIENLKAVLDAGAHLEAKAERGFTPLLISIDSPDRLTATALLLEKGAEVNVKDAIGNTPLMMAALGGFMPQVKLLLQHGAHIDDTNVAGWTALMLATEGRHREIVRTLIEAGANVEIKDKEGISAITRAIQTQDETIIKEFAALTPSLASLVNQERQAHELRKAVLTKNVEQVRRLLAEGADVELRDAEGATPLLIAVLVNDPSLLRLLIAAKADVNKPLKEGITPLMLAAARGGLEAANLLLQSGARVNEKDKQGRTALFYATTQEPGAASSDVITALIKAGADINWTDAKGMNATDIACLQEQWSMTQQFINAGAKATDPSCALLSASAIGSPAQVQALLKSGIDVNIQHKENKLTALHTAVKRERSDIAETLVRAGASVNIEDAQGKTALSQAIDKGNRTLVSALLKSKTGLSKGEGGLVEMLFQALERDEAGIVGDLIAAGVDPNARDDEGRTPLMLARSIPVFMTLIRARANVSLKDRYGWTPLFHVVTDRYFVDPNLTRVRTLIRAGANVNAKDEQGRTVLLFAIGNASQNATQLVQLLLQAGATFNRDNAASALILASRQEHEGRYKGVVSFLISRLPKLDKASWHDVLVQAVTDGNVLLAKRAIGAGAAVRIRDDNNRSLLMLAARTNAETTQILISAGVDVNLKDNAGDTALMDAAKSHCGPCLRALIKAGADVNAQDDEGQTALMIAVKSTYGVDEIVSALLSGGAKLDVFNQEGDNALLVASTWGSAEVIHSLLEAGAATEAKDREGKTPLIRAVLARDGRYPAPERGAEVIRLLLKAHADINAIDNEGATALITAARKGYSNLVRLLVESGAKIGVRTKAGTNALVEVLTAHDEENQSLDPIPRLTPAAQIEIAQDLIKAGIDVNSRAEDGSTPLMIVAFRGEARLVKLLLDLGADVNAQNDQGRTALMLAAGQGNTNAVRLLLDAKADPRIKDHTGIDALSLAKGNNHTEVVLLLNRRDQ